MTFGSVGVVWFWNALFPMEQSTVEIYNACYEGDLDLVKRLITRGTSPWVHDNQSNTLFHLCCSSYHCGLDVLQYLIATSEIVSCSDLCNHEGSTPLHLACGAGKREFVEFLIHGHHNDNFDFGLPNYQGETPLYFASRNGHEHIVSLICTNPDYMLDPDDIYQCIKVAPNWDIMAILLRAISFKDFMTRVRQEKHAKQIFKNNATIQWKDSSSPFFHQVARSGDLDIVQYLVNEVECDVNCLDSEAYTHPQCNIHVKDKWDRTPLHAAAECGQLQIAKFLTEDMSVDINLVGHYRETPLYMACWHGHLPLVEYFTSQYHCNINLKDYYGRHPLHVAACRGHLEIVKHLVDSKGCDINVSDDKGYTPIHNTCNNGHLSVVEYLSSKPQCNLEVLDYTGHQPLHYALCQGHKKVVMLLREKVSVDGIHQCIKSAVEDKVPGSMIELLVSKINIKKYLTRRLEEDQPIFSSNDTVLRDIIEADCPLHRAIELGCVDVTEYLVNIGVFDINLKLKYRYNTPLHIACEKGHFEIVKMLTNHPQCNIDAENNTKQRPLHNACLSGNVDIVQHLMVEKGCDVTAKDDWGDTPLHEACTKGDFEIVKILTNHPQCNIEPENNRKWRPLHLACQSGNVDIVQHLVVEKGCDVTAKDDWGDTPLHEACTKGDFEIVKILTNHPQCNIEPENNRKWRPLHLACQSGNVDIVQHLVVEKGCDVTAKDDWGDTPLHEACTKGDFEIVKILTNHPQCNIEPENNRKWRPLHLACQSGNVDIVQHLVVEKGCDVTAKEDRYGDTPLHIACKQGHFEIVKILTNHPQCNIEAENIIKQRPLHKTCQSGNVDIVQHLVEDKGCDITAKDDSGNTPLHIACDLYYLDVVKILTNCPTCDIEAENNEHERPLHLAYTAQYLFLNFTEPKQSFQFIIARARARARANRNLIIQLLVSKGCDISTVSDRQLHSNISRYQQALRSSGEAKLRVVKCILTGPPGAGKSTLKKRLLNESLTEPSLSTGVVDAAIQVDSFRKLQQHNAVVTTEWRTQDLDEEAVLMFENIASNTAQSHPPHPNIETVHPDRLVTCRDNIIDIRDDYTEKLEEDNNDSYSDGEVSITVQEDAKRMGDLVEEIEEEEIDDNNVGFKENTKTTKSNKGVDSLSKFVESIPIKKRKTYEERSGQTTKDNHAMLHIIDTGGQPEFHEMLPALITGPAINLLVFDLTIDLTSRYEITYRSSSGDSKPYQTSLTHEEVIFRSLASIACLRQNTIGWSFDEVPLKDESEPAAFLIATHRDCFPNEAEAQAKVDSVNNYLKLKIQTSGELFNEDLVRYSTLDQVIFALDTRNDQTEIEELRSILHQVIDRNFCELPVPASWCAFSLKLRKSKKSLHLLDACFKIAQDCGIKDREDFKSVLWFLHHRVGVIMYYPEVEGLGNIIITDLQLVFDRITQLITSCFTFEELGSVSSEKEFRDNGRFSESHVKQLSSRKGDPLTPTRLVSLLKHLHIVAGPMKIKVGRKTENYYFMPCALKPAPVEEEQRDESICPAPLTIYFECGYTPVGVFCCLVVYLLSQTSKSELEWKLHDKIVHHRNKITFIISKYYDRITLISRATYLEVWVDQKTPKLSLDVLCEQIISTLHRGLETVTQSLHYTYKSHHFFGFICCCPECHSVPSHPAVVDENDLAAECVLTREVMRLQERRHLVWSTKVYSLFPCIHYILCNTY